MLQESTTRVAVKSMTPVTLLLASSQCWYCCISVHTSRWLISAGWLLSGTMHGHTWIVYPHARTWAANNSRMIILGYSPSRSPLLARCHHSCTFTCCRLCQGVYKLISVSLLFIICVFNRLINSLIEKLGNTLCSYNVVSWRAVNVSVFSAKWNFI